VNITLKLAVYGADFSPRGELLKDRMLRQVCV
jgi:hypothetical protein